MNSHADHDPVSEDEVAQALRRIHRRLDRRRRLRRGASVAVSLATFAGVGLALRVNDQPHDEVVASGTNATAAAASREGSSSSAPPEEEREGGICGSSPLPAEQAGLEMALDGVLAWSAPSQQPDAGRSVVVRVENLGSQEVQLTHGGGVEIVVMDADGKVVAAGHDTPWTIRATFIGPSDVVELDGWLPNKSCADFDSDRLLPPGTYRVAPVVSATSGGGDAVVVYGDIATVTYG